MATGHKGSVRCLAVSDSEHFFVSGSKDRTVKLWLLRNQGSGSAHLSPHLTYSHHQKSVSHVELMSAMSYIVSCDGTVHVSHLSCIYRCVFSWGGLYLYMHMYNTCNCVWWIAEATTTQVHIGCSVDVFRSNKVLTTYTHIHV